MHPYSPILGMDFVAEKKTPIPHCFLFLAGPAVWGVVCTVIGAKACHMKKGVACGLSAWGSSAGISEIWHKL